MSDTKDVVNLDDVQMKARGNVGKFAYRHGRIGSDIGLEKLGCSVYAVPPGKSAYPYHAHSSMEEMCIVLESSGTLRRNETEQPIRTGDGIASKIGIAHQIINSSEQDLRYVVISNNEPVDVVFYPDSNNVGAYSDALGKPLLHLTHQDAATHYYDAEE